MRAHPGVPRAGQDHPLVPVHGRVLPGGAGSLRYRPVPVSHSAAGGVAHGRQAAGEVQFELKRAKTMVHISWCVRLLGCFGLHVFPIPIGFW